jgi:hypothetical protein
MKNTLNGLKSIKIEHVMVNNEATKNFYILSSILGQFEPKTISCYCPFNDPSNCIISRSIIQMLPLPLRHLRSNLISIITFFWRGGWGGGRKVHLIYIKCIKSFLRFFCVLAHRFDKVCTVPLP